MALTQRLEFRQSQSLVMTPQLMQAIKLLQLSNLDLSAFVEEELERNPLLERASDGPEPPVAGEPAPERGEFSDSDDSGYLGDEAGAERSEAAGACGDGFEPVQEEWLNRDLGSRAEIEQTLDTAARQRILGGAGRGRGANRAGCGSDRLYRMGRRCLQ